MRDLEGRKTAMAITARRSTTKASCEQNRAQEDEAENGGTPCEERTKRENERPAVSMKPVGVRRNRKGAQGESKREGDERARETRDRRETAWLESE